MANRTYSVKFKSEGLAALVKDLKQASAVFDRVLADSQKSVNKLIAGRREQIVQEELFRDAYGGSRSDLRASREKDTSALSPKLVVFSRHDSTVPKVVLFNSPFKGGQSPQPTIDVTRDRDSLRDRDTTEFISSWNRAVDSFFTRLPSELKGAMTQNRGNGPKGMISSGTGFVAQSFFFGAFSRIGESLTEDFSRGFYKGLQSRLNASFRRMGTSAGTYAADKGIGVVKSFQRPEDAAAFKKKLGELLVASNSAYRGFGQSPGEAINGFKSLAATLVKLNPGELRAVWGELSQLARLPDLTIDGDNISGTIRQAILEYNSLAEGLELISKDIESGMAVFRDTKGSIYAINATGKDVIASFANKREESRIGQELLGDSSIPEYDVVTTVNGHVDSNLSKADTKAAIAVAKEMKRQFQALLNQIDEAVLTNTPTDVDSKGGKRGSIYQRFGFVPTESGQQVAFVSAGKVVDVNNSREELLPPPSTAHPLRPEIESFFADSSTKGLPESFKQRIAEFRRAIANDLDEVAKEIGELLIRDIKAAKELALNVTEDLKSSASSVDIPAIESKKTATIRELSKLESEVLKGSSAQGRAPIGLQQLQQQGRITGIQIATGLSVGVTEGTSDVTDAAVELGEAAIDAAEDTLDIQSPSKVFKRIGQFVGLGFIEGVNSTVGAVRKATTVAFDFGKDATETLKNRIDEEIVQPKHINLDDFIDNLSSDALDIAANGFNKLSSGIGSIYKSITDNFPILGKFRDALIGFGAAFLAKLGIEAAIEFLTKMQGEAFKTAVRFEVLKNTIVGASGGIAEGTKNIAFLTSEVKRLSLDLEAATEAYAALKAASQGTPLEGAASDQIFSAVGEAAVAKGLDPQQQQRVFLAIQQMISKGKISAEELRQQLGEALPGALQTAARALGVTTQQLDKMLESGELLATDFLPKFAAQLSAENASGVAGATNTAQASLTRFNNSITNLKKTVGEASIDANKLGLNILADSIDLVNKNAAIFVKIFTGLTAVLLLEIAALIWKIVSFFLQLKSGGSTLATLANLLRTIGSILRGLLPLIARFILVTAAIETWSNVFKLTQDSFKDIGEYANASAKGLDNLARAYRDAGKAAGAMPTPPKRERDLISRGGPEILGVKFNLDTMYRKPLDMLFEQFGGGWTTQGQRELADFKVNASNLMDGVYRNIDESKTSEKTIADIQKIDRRLEAIRSKRFDLLPGDRDGLAKSIEAEQQLLQEREKLLKITSTISSNFARDAENIKKTIEAIDRLPEGADTDAVRSQLEQALKDISGTQTVFDNLINSISRGISELDRRMRNLNEGTAAFNEQLEQNTSSAKTDLINQGIQQGRDPSKIQFDSQRLDKSALELRIGNLTQTISNIEKDLASPALSETVKNLGIDPNTVGSEQLQRMLGEGRSAQEQSALKAIQSLKSNRQQLKAAEEQLANSGLQLSSTLKDFTLQLTDFYTQLWRQFEDFGVEVRRAVQELQQQYNNTALELESTYQSTVLTNLKTSLTQPLLTQAQRLLNGTNDAFEQYLNSLLGGLEKMFEIAGLDQQLKQQIEQIGQSIQGLSNAQEDRVRQWTRMTQDKQKEYRDMMRGSPNETFGGSPTPTGNNSESILPVPKSSPPPEANGELPPPPNQGGASEENAPTNLTEEQKFTLKAISIARRIGAEPIDLLTLMSFETSGTLSPTIQGPEVFDKRGRSQGRARGLIQFMPATAKNLGTSDAQLAAMSRIDQLDYVLKYFQSAAKGFNFQGKGLKPLYATVFAGSPTARGSISDGYHTLDGAVDRMKREHGGKARKLLGFVQSTSDSQAASTPTSTSQTIDRSAQLPLNDAANTATNQLLPQDVQSGIAATDFATQQNIQLLGRKKDAVTALTDAQKTLADVQNQLDTQQRQNQLDRYIQDQGYAVDELSDRLSDLQDKYLPDTALKQHKSALRSLMSEYAQTGRQLKNQISTLEQQKERFTEVSTVLRSTTIPYLEQWKKQLEAVGDTKAAAGIQTIIDALNQEAQFLEMRIPQLTQLISRYQNQLERLPEIRQLATARLGAQSIIGQRQEALDKDRTLTESDNSVLDAQGNLLQSYGDEFGANRLFKQRAIAEEDLRYRQQLLDIDKQIAENPAKYTADDVARLRQNAEALNTVNLQNINQQFKDLGQVIESEVQGALTGFFEDIFTNTKSVGEAFRDMALNILKSIARIAAQQVVLNIFGKANGAKDGFRGLFGKLLGHADGGLVVGEGTGTSDSILRRLSNGEFVLRAAAVKHWGTGFLSDLNAMRQPQLAYSFDGGLGDRGNSRGVSNPTLIVNVTSPDVNSFRRSESQVGREAGELYRRSLMRNG